MRSAIRVQRASRLFAVSVLFALLAIAPGCSKDSANEDPLTPETPIQSTIKVRTGETGTLRNSQGVELTVFPGTVPTTLEGQPGELVFSIEPAVVPVPAPDGYVMSGEPWQLGPEGINFADRCRLAMPVPDLTSAYLMGRYDASTSAWEIVPTILDPAAPDRVCADVKHLSVWALFRSVAGPSNPSAMGAVHLRNVDGTRTVSLCLKSFALEYPSAHPNFEPASAGAIVAESGHNGGAGGLRSEIDLFLPQGTYVFEATRFSTIPNLTGTAPEGWIELPPFTVDGPWSPGAVESTITMNPSGWLAANHSPERAPCEGDPDYAFGTGDVQVTLTWEDPVDLDLHVIEPSGEEIYFGHPASATGGLLDRDTICQGTQTGKPENIFWASGSAPRGGFQVNVHLWSLCSRGGGPIPFHVRTVVDGVAHTYSGSVLENETKTITRFVR